MNSTSLTPQNPQVQNIYTQAQQLENARQMEQAQHEYRRVLDLEPAFWPARYHLALLLQQSGQAHEAIRQFQQLLEEIPENYGERSRTFTMIGQMLLERGFLDEARLALEQALRSPEPDCFAHFYLGEVFFSRHQWKRARQHFESFLHHYPDQSYALYRAQVVLKLLHITRLTGVDFYPAHWDTCLSNEPCQGLQLAPLLTLPVLFNSTCERQTWIQHWSKELDKLETKTIQLQNPLWELPPPDFYRLAQGPENMRPYLERINGLLQCSLPEINLQPVFPDNEFRTPRLGIWVDFQRDRYRFLLPLLQQLNEDYQTLFIGSGRIPPALLQQESLQLISLPRDLKEQRKEILKLELDFLIFSELGPLDLNALLLAHYRLAPVQAVLPGYPVSSGIATVDFYLSSELLEPQDAAEAYTETLICFKGLPWSPAPLTPSLLPREYFRWPSDQTLYLCPVKAHDIHPDFDAILAALCAQDPKALILVLGQGVPDLDQRILTRWHQDSRVDPERLQLLPPLQARELLSLAQHADLILEPFYWGLGPQVLTYLALGTPVVSWPGKFQRSRLTQAAYRLLELDTGCTDSPAEYLRQALNWGCNQEARQAFSAELLARRERLDSYPDYLRSMRHFIQAHIKRQF